MKTVDEYLIKNPVDIRVGYILCRHNFGQNAIVRPWSIIWAFFHHIENNSDDENKYFHKCNKNFFRFQVLFSKAGRFRRRSFRKPNLIRIKADPNYLDQLN